MNSRHIRGQKSIQAGLLSLNTNGQSVRPPLNQQVAHPKSVFRPVYLITMILTLLDLTCSLVKNIYIPENSPKVLAAFVGPNVIHAQTAITAFLCASAIYLFVTYAIIECFEERIGSMSLGWSGCVIARFLEFLLRALAVGVIIIGVKKFHIINYTDALQFILIVSIVYLAWQVFIYISNRSKRLKLPLITNFIVSVGFGMLYYLSSNSIKESNFGLVIIVVMTFSIAVIVFTCIHWLVTEFAPIRRAIWGYISTI